MGERDLNQAQAAAVTHPPGPLLVLAGAGSGKTRVLTQRVVHHIRSHGVAPDRVLAVTFTNKAAREMQERVARALSLPVGAPRPVILTFHSLGLRLLRKFRKAAGLPEVFAIYDQGDQRALARRVLTDTRVQVPSSLQPEGLLAYVSDQKALRRGPDEALAAGATFRGRKLAELYREYHDALRGAGALDFEDLLFEPLRLLSRDPDVRTAARDLFDALLVDEYQDTNENQYLLVSDLAHRTRTLTVVGDDDQSIYAWRGADYRNLIRFQHDYPEAARVALEVNYRSTAVILEAANAIVRGMPGRLEKTLRPAGEEGDPIRLFEAPDDEAEAVRVVKDLADRASEFSLGYGAFGILYRTNKQAVPLEEALRRARIPYRVVGGQKFFEKKEVKDLLAFLRAMVSPRDELALRRIWNTPPRGLGAEAQKRLEAHARGRGIPLRAALGEAEEAGLSAKAAEGAAELASAFASLETRRQRGEPFPGLARELLARLGYARELDRLYEDPGTTAKKADALEALLASMETFHARDGSRGLEGFLEEMALLDELDRTREESQGVGVVTLMTVHAAKGLEYEHVYLVGLEDGLFPSERSVDEGGAASLAEERRLFYVAVTRARVSLTVSWCRRRGLDTQKARDMEPSPFLALLPETSVTRLEADHTATGELRRARNLEHIARLKASLAGGKK